MQNVTKALYSAFRLRNSIRTRMVLAFLFLTLLLLSFGLATLLLMKENSELSRVYGTINRLQIYTLSLFKNDNDFFDLETINTTYFTTHESEFLARRDSLNLIITTDLNRLINGSTVDQNLQLDAQVIQEQLAAYNERFSRLEALVWKKGFKDWGLEGLMRHYAHQLEKSVYHLDMSELLLLRRNEKDFLLRMDTAYVEHFNSRANALLAELRAAPSDSATVRQLLSYQQAFNAVANIAKQVGLTSNSGLRSELNSLTFDLAGRFVRLEQYTEQRSKASERRTYVVFGIVFFCAVVFSLLCSLWLSNRLSQPIKGLSKSMHAITERETFKPVQLPPRHAGHEIDTLINVFNKLMYHLGRQMDKIKVQSLLLKQKNLELKKLNRELDNFIYSTAHDLRSPLTSLLGLLNIMRLENEQPHLQPYIAHMESSVKRLDQFISQIVSYAKNKKLDLNLQVIDLKQLIEETFNDYQFIPGADRISKSIKVRSEADFVSDRNRIQTIFNNLISNSIRYADFEKATPSIQIDVAVNTQEAIIIFSDNGLGIAEEHLQKVFHMFYRANNQSKGSGLGLFILKETIKKLGGTVSVSSQQSVGTEFRVIVRNGIHDNPDPKQFTKVEAKSAAVNL